jgi:hypothetical protein
MKRITILCSLVACVITSSQSFAQEYFYPNGVFVGVDVKASIMQREKKIDYGQWNVDTPISGTRIRDVAPSPSLTAGYKFNSNDSVSFRTDWAGYSVNRRASNNGSLGCGFGFFSVDGGLVNGSCSLPASAAMKWRSNAVNGDLEYQRRLWSDQLGAILGLLGFGYRFEGQKFEGEGSVPTGLVDSTKENLDEHLFGPFGGLKVSFKPFEGSNFSFNLKSNFGYYFKSASMRAREQVDPAGTVGIGPAAFRANDNSSKGTAFATVGTNVSYAVMKNLNIALDYKFSWINEAAHIQNPGLNPATFFTTGSGPAKIGTTSLLDHRVGLDFIFSY